MRTVIFQDGRTLLHRAVACGITSKEVAVEVVKLLLAAGANPNARDAVRSRCTMGSGGNVHDKRSNNAHCLG